ncbi:GAF domain-containing sensor histidine kinase [Halobacillus massiliensis]|uniref:GAF domain-containing sensor histidine kinase n=1 Tax=Halobacillus massiliensis TaxID=1926286 RepID=UPI0009E5C2D2|nr:GAF domain-containing sensor histidine kinase [Halobacillus massiliensis]
MQTYGNRDDLKTLKVIAETLNRSNDLHEMLDTVLQKLLDLTELEAGWIFLSDKKSHFTLVADYGLPPALTRDNKMPMCQGDCYCLNSYWNRKLDGPINIIECRRLNRAIKFELGDTNGISHHATIPLSAGGESFGLLNVASPNKEIFTEDELTLLQSLAFQIGTAVKRTRLYQEQQKRADHYIKLNEVVRTLWGALDIDQLSEQVSKQGKTFNWSTVGFFTIHGEEIRAKALLPVQGTLMDKELFLIQEAIEKEKPRIERNTQTNSPESIALPVMIKDEKIGALYFSEPLSSDISEVDLEILQALNVHIALIYESLRLKEKYHDWLIFEERKRLARDLHDSVNQQLFSLSLTARGAKEVSPKDDPYLIELLEEIMETSQKSMEDMRSLIWQLRPIGLEEGLISALKKYASSLGLTLSLDLSSIPNWSQRFEETIFRISQEAMNNVKKHANVQRMVIQIKENDQGICVTFQDQGSGFRQDKVNPNVSLGLISMKERIKNINGELDIYSKPGEGTKIKIWVPNV